LSFSAEKNFFAVAKSAGPGLAIFRLTRPKFVVATGFVGKVAGEILGIAPGHAVEVCGLISFSGAEGQVCDAGRKKQGRDEDRREWENVKERASA